MFAQFLRDVKTMLAGLEPVWTMLAGLEPVYSGVARGGSSSSSASAVVLRMPARLYCVTCPQSAKLPSPASSAVLPSMYRLEMFKYHLLQMIAFWHLLTEQQKKCNLYQV